jgi:hypothetical protein
MSVLVCENSWYTVLTLLNYVCEERGEQRRDGMEESEERKGGGAIW